jgi:butyryl-CoA dehydrogenase
MDFSLTNEQKMLQTVVRQFAEKEVLPIAAEIDQNHRFPRETVKKMTKAQMFGIPFPVSLGGSGGDDIGYVIAIEELAKKCATTAIILSAHTSLCCWPIYKFGTDPQKQRYLTRLLKGELLGAFALTEPNAGTDAASQQTTAVLHDDHYILNGSKTFITNAGQADVYIVFAMTDRAQGVKGISAFIVEKETVGFTIGKIEDKLGIRASATGELIFVNCKIPVTNLLGKIGQGFRVAMQTLDGGRIGVAAQALGIAEGAMEEAVKYAKQRKQFGKPIAQFQGLQWMMAEMETKINAAKWLVYNAAYLKSIDQPYTKEAAMAKLYASEVAMDITTKAVQIHGGYGYIRDYPVERMLRDAKITEIYEGTSEVQKMVIAANL